MSRLRFLKRLVGAGALAGGGVLVTLWALPAVQEFRNPSIVSFSITNWQIMDRIIIIYCFFVC